MGSLLPETQAVLRERYRATEREHSEVMGLRAAFGDLSTLAWWICADHDDMRKRLSSGKGKRDPEVTKLRNRATAANREAHRSWLDAEGALAMATQVPSRRAQ